LKCKELFSPINGFTEIIGKCKKLFTPINGFPKINWKVEDASRIRRDQVGLIIVNLYDMVWKPFVLGDCVPCAGSRLKNPLSFYCFDNSQFIQFGVRNGYQLFVLPTRAISYGIFYK
jgi:hypothetical protein